jgi:ubiquitin-protein ligase
MIYYYLQCFLVPLAMLFFDPESSSQKPAVQMEENFYEKKGWHCRITIEYILKTIQHILSEPDLESPANAAAYALYKENKELFIHKMLQSIQKKK